MTSNSHLAFAISFLDMFAVGLLNPITHTLLRSDLIGAQ